MNSGVTPLIKSASLLDDAARPHSLIPTAGTADKPPSWGGFAELGDGRNLRIFRDENDKMNLSLKDVNGELLIISQFTLYGNCKDGNRPSFVEAARPEQAIPLYEYFISECKKQISVVETGVFGADMKVELLNDGPVTIIIESKK